MIDLLHWACLDTWAAGHAETTAPAGFRCPQCQDTIFPQANQSSPIIEKLRKDLARGNWARTALGLPIVREMIEMGYRLGAAARTGRNEETGII